MECSKPCYQSREKLSLSLSVERKIKKWDEKEKGISWYMIRDSSAGTIGAEKENDKDHDCKGKEIVWGIKAKFARVFN